jgi:hypothetical protein
MNHGVTVQLTSGHVGALMVAAEEEEVLGELDLVAKQEQDCLKGLLSPVDIVAEEEIVGLRREAAHLEHADEIGVLNCQHENAPERERMRKERGSRA